MQLLEKCDADDNGYISYTEFMSACNQEPDDKLLKSMFDDLDDDRSGYIERSELERIHINI